MMFDVDVIERPKPRKRLVGHCYLVVADDEREATRRARGEFTGGLREYEDRVARVDHRGEATGPVFSLGLGVPRA
jgi:hypothetical protein